jgi:hypothetical protein
MNNSEARDVLERLRSDPADGEAWDLIKALLWGLSGDVTDDRSLREPAAETVLHKLQDQAICNDLPEIRSPRAYFRTQLRWRIIDLVRRRNRPPPPKPPPPPPEPELLHRDVLQILDDAYKLAIKRRDPWQRHHLEAAWPQILRLHFEDVKLRALVISDGDLDPTDVEAVRKAVQRAHTAHRRTRAAVLESIQWMEERGRIDSDTAADARRAINRLKRRQVRTPPVVSGAEDKSHER